MPSRFDHGTVGTNYSSIHSIDAFVGDYQVLQDPLPMAIPLLTTSLGHVHPGQLSADRTSPEEVHALQQSRVVQVSE